MVTSRRIADAGTVVALIAVVIVSVLPAVVDGSGQYSGRSLAEALETLQAAGLRIVFTSAIVPRDLRVATDPRAGASPRQQLDELLAPHGLEVRAGPRGILEIVRSRPVKVEPRPTALGAIEGTVIDALSAAPVAGVHVRVDGGRPDARTDGRGRFRLPRVEPGERVLQASTMPAYAHATRTVQVVPGSTLTVTLSLVPAYATYREYISVIRSAPHRSDPGVVSEISLDRGDLDRLSGSLADDPARAVHALPRVAAVDDFRSEFAVRGSPLRHVDFVVDGVSTPWLQHTAHRRGATGSLSMFPGYVLEDATLRVGAYPRRYGNRIGPQLDLTLREGSRDRRIFRGAVGGSHATLVGEGPLGASARGSWLAAFRQSYREWPTERPESTRTPFGYFDGMAKAVYDVRDGQQVALSVLAGTSNIDVEDNLAPNALGNGSNRALVMNVSWRSALGPVVLTQQAYMVRHHSVNEHQSGEPSDRGSSQKAVYRVGVRRPIAEGLLEAGAQLGRTAVGEIPRSTERALEASSWLRSGYVHLAWPVTPAFTISPGARVDSASHLAERTVTRWLLGEWVFRPGWTLNGSGGVAQQLPEPDQLLGGTNWLDLRAERSTHVDIGLEQQLTDGVRWQATVFDRSEADVLREPDGYPRLVDDVVTPPERQYANALRGTSRGIELLVHRRSESGLTGWAAYSYGRTRYTDAQRGETFWADLDQRHAFTLFGDYRLSSRTSIGVTFRAGSNFPVPAYLAERSDGVYVGAQRNQLRLPAYSRLDARANYEFTYLGRNVALFAETLNVLNRPNAGLASGSIDPATGEATGFTDSLFRRRVAAGLLVEF